MLEAKLSCLYITETWRILIISFPSRQFLYTTAFLFTKRSDCCFLAGKILAGSAKKGEKRNRQAPHGYPWQLEVVKSYACLPLCCLFLYLHFRTTRYTNFTSSIVALLKQQRRFLVIKTGLILISLQSEIRTLKNSTAFLKQLPSKCH